MKLIFFDNSEDYTKHKILCCFYGLVAIKKQNKKMMCKLTSIVYREYTRNYRINTIVIVRLVTLVAAAAVVDDRVRARVGVGGDGGAWRSGTP